MMDLVLPQQALVETRYQRNPDWADRSSCGNREEARLSELVEPRLQAGGCVLLAGVSPPFILLFIVVNPNPRIFSPVILFREGGKEGEREKHRHIDWLPLHEVGVQDQACN